LFEKTLHLKPDSYILKMELARLYVSSNEASYYPKAKKLLDELEFYERDSPEYWVLRATVYGKLGKEGPAQWMLAEAEALRGDHDRVLVHTRRAKEKLKPSDKIAKQRLEDLLANVEK